MTCPTGRVRIWAQAAMVATLSLAAKLFAPKPELKVHRDLGWDNVKRPVLTTRAARPRVESGQKPPLFEFFLASLPFLLKSLVSKAEPWPLRPQELSLSTCLLSRRQAHRQPFPQFHPGPLALCFCLPRWLGTLALTSLPRQNENVQLLQRRQI